MPRLTSRLDDTVRARLQPLKLRDLVCSSEGEAVAAQLISVLVTEHLTATGSLTVDLYSQMGIFCNCRKPTLMDIGDILNLTLEVLQRCTKILWVVCRVA